MERRAELAEVESELIMLKGRLERGELTIAEKLELRLQIEQLEERRASLMNIPILPDQNTIDILRIENAQLRQENERLKRELTEIREEERKRKLPKKPLTTLEKEYEELETTIEKLKMIIQTTKDNQIVLEAKRKAAARKLYQTEEEKQIARESEAAIRLGSATIQDATEELKKANVKFTRVKNELKRWRQFQPSIETAAFPLECVVCQTETNKHCARCNEAYCSLACQTRDWNLGGHSDVCK